MAKIIASVAGTVVYLGLAILGAGGVREFFAVPAYIALLAVMVASAVAALFTEASLSAGVREDRGNRWVLSVFGVLGLVSAWLPPYTDRHEFWTFGGDGVRWLGVAVLVVGVVLRIWPVFVLGHRFSGLVAIQPGHTLVTTGIYQTVRNPSYLGMLLTGVGWALGFRSVAGLVVASLMLIPTVARIRSEEALLSSEFGAQYREYCAHTWRLIPGVY
jgi:protein-S-isoprenylcysteine O-methyltransferase Ste14